MACKMAIQGVDGFSLSQLQVSMESTLHVQMIRFVSGVTAMAQQTMVTFRLRGISIRFQIMLQNEQKIIIFEEFQSLKKLQC